MHEAARSIMRGLAQLDPSYPLRWADGDLSLIGGLMEAARGAAEGRYGQGYRYTGDRYSDGSHTNPNPNSAPAPNPQHRCWP